MAPATPTRSPRYAGPFGVLFVVLTGTLASAQTFLAFPVPGSIPPSEPAPVAKPADDPGQDPSQDPSQDPGEKIDETAAPVEHLITLLSGAELSGFIVTESATSVTLRIQGERTMVPRAQIASMVELPPVLERFRARRAELDDDNVESRLYLVEWLREREAYAVALEEVRSIRVHDPYNARAVWLDKVLVEQIRLVEATDRRRKTAGERPEGVPDDADAPDEAPPRPRVGEFPSLTTDEVNLIRVFEMDLNDPPAFVLTRDSVAQFIETYRDHRLMPRHAEGRQALLHGSEIGVIDLMFRMQARDYYHEIRVREDPESIQLFRERVHDRWLINACATSRCHGGQEAGRLWLNTTKSRSDRTAYTNLLILERYELEDGTPLIDYEQPALSPLLQMALPREDSLHPHPAVRASSHRGGWRPQFRSEGDTRYERAVDWIESMYRPRPTYPITYSPPVSRSAQRKADLEAESTGPVER